MNTVRINNFQVDADVGDRELKMMEMWWKNKNNSINNRLKTSAYTTSFTLLGVTDSVDYIQRFHTLISTVIVTLVNPNNHSYYHPFYNMLYM